MTLRESLLAAIDAGVTISIGPEPEVPSHNVLVHGRTDSTSRLDCWMLVTRDEVEDGDLMVDALAQAVDYVTAKLETR